MRILVTSDDGKEFGSDKLVASLKVACPKRAKRGLRVYGAFPGYDRSGIGGAAHISGVLRLSSRSGVVAEAFPVDCVRYGLARQKLDWVFVGINRGANLGPALITSGTACAAAYAAMCGIKAVAISQSCVPDDISDPYQPAEFVIQVLREVYKNPPPKGTFYNINLPSRHAPKGKELRWAIVDEVGRGGYVSSVNDTVYEGSLWFNSEWRALSKPEKLLEKGYVVVQLLRPFAVEKGGVGDEKCAGKKPKKPKKRQSRSRCSAKPVGDGGIG